MPLPTKLFDVRNIANAVDADATAYPNAVGIIFRDSPARNKVLDAFADQYGYNAANDGSKSNFFNKVITNQIKAIVRNNEGGAARKTAQATLETDLP